MLVVWKWLQNKYFEKSNAPDFVGLFKPGMKVWECDLKTGDIVEAEIFEVERDNFFVGKLKSREVLMKPGCIYEVALNGQNAVKKFEKKIVKHYANR